MDNQMKPDIEINQEELNRIRTIFEASGLNISIGG